MKKNSVIYRALIVLTTISTWVESNGPINIFKMMLNNKIQGIGIHSDVCQSIL